MSSTWCDQCWETARLPTYTEEVHSSFQDMMRTARSGCQLCAAVFCGINEQLGLNDLNKNESNDFHISCKAVRRKTDLEDFIHHFKYSWKKELEVPSEEKSEGSTEEEVEKEEKEEDEEDEEEEEDEDSNGSYLHLVFSSKESGELHQFLPKQPVKGKQNWFTRSDFSHKLGQTITSIWNSIQNWD
jgi:hypothetical protein